MSQPGFSVESAASVIARDTITKHLATFAHVIGNDRAASQSTAAAYIDGLAGVLALSVQGGQCDMEGVERAIQTLREAITRDLRHLRPKL